MSTYSAHHRVTGPDHPLNGGLRAYCQGNLPRLPWATGYDPKNLGYDRFPPLANNWEPYTLYQGTAPPLQAEKEGPPT
jgi:hypothetical protein